MSDSSLSPPLMSEPSLPILPPAPPSLQPRGLRPLQLRHTASLPRLSKSDSQLFSAGLFSRTLLDTTPLTVQLQCMQPQCKYTPKPQRLDHTITSNYWTHYKNAHPEIAVVYKLNIPQSFSSQSSSQTSNVATFFTPRLSKPIESTVEAFQTKFQALLLDFVVSNNLALHIVDSQSHRWLI
jgi:hypothetical protein